MAISSLTPIMPSSERSHILKEKAFDLTKKTSALLPHNHLLKTLKPLVQVMNCYYSNLIEGHDTLPYDVENALNNNLSDDSTTRDLQQEALAHIRVQNLIDNGESASPSMSIEFLEWCHQKFYQQLPASMLMIEHAQTGKSFEIVPGKFRERGVKVGNHIAPDSEHVKPMLSSLFAMYKKYSGTDALIAIAAANHRVAWVHPFMDGNGRTVRLMAHAALKDLGMNIGLWSPSRGLARSVNQYKQLLSRADQVRQGSSTDGRGALSEQGLIDFCDYYLDTCIDQVEFMQGLFDIGNLSKRIEKYCYDEHERSNLSADAFLLLREAIYRGQFERGEVSHIIYGKSAVTARRVLKALLDRGLLESDTPRGAVRLAVPTHVLSSWFPNLYPENAL